MNSTEGVPQQFFRSVPVQLIRTSRGIVIKRGTLEFEVLGDIAESCITAALSTCSGQAVRLAELVSCVVKASDIPEDEAHAFISSLIQRRLLVPVTKPELVSCPQELVSADVFYWHFGMTKSEITNQLNSRPIYVIGTNAITQQILRAFELSGISNCRVVDDPELRETDGLEAASGNEAPIADPNWARGIGIEEWKKSADPKATCCVIATSTMSNQTALRSLNSYCCSCNLHFLPVFLRDLQGFVGPLVIPGQTACLECAHARASANLANRETKALIESSASGSERTTGFHPLMAAAVAHLAVMEIIKFYSNIPQSRFGYSIEINLLSSWMRPRRILKLPRCTVCSNLNVRSAVNITRYDFQVGR